MRGVRCTYTMPSPVPGRGQLLVFGFFSANSRWSCTCSDAASFVTWWYWTSRVSTTYVLPIRQLASAARRNSFFSS